MSSEENGTRQGWPLRIAVNDYHLNSSLFSKRVLLGLFVRVESLQGPAFSESPLLKANISVMGGLYFSWIFMESKTLVEADK